MNETERGISWTPVGIGFTRHCADISGRGLKLQIYLRPCAERYLPGEVDC